MLGSMLSPASLKNGIGLNERSDSPTSDMESTSDSTVRSSSLDPDIVSQREENSYPARGRPLLGVFVTSKPAAPQLPYASQQTGLVYDARMRFHTEKELDEDEDIHPEDPRRIYAIHEELKSAGLLADEDDELDPAEQSYKLARIPVKFAEPDEICLVHTRDHYMWMEALQCMFFSV